jgi:hypothetical protein
MLRPDFDAMFKRVCKKVSDKQVSDIKDFENGRTTLMGDTFVNYNSFVVTQTQDNITNKNTDTNSMNTNLNYLLQKWDY